MKNQLCCYQNQLINALIQPPLILLQKDFMIIKTHMNHPDFNSASDCWPFENRYYIHLKLSNIRKTIVNTPQKQAFESFFLV